MSDNSHRIIRLETTGSTNADAMRAAVEGVALPVWFLARHQTSGRGRSGRSWISADGNLYASAAIAVDAPLRVAGQLSLVAGVCLMDAIVEVLPPQLRGTGLRLKWPNDVLLGGAKVAGILVESTTRVGHPGFVAVLGFGVNVAAVPTGLDVAAGSLGGGPGESGPALETVFAALRSALDRRLTDWNGGAGFARIRDAWTALAGPHGEAIAVNTTWGRTAGRYRGLAESGALLVEVDGRTREIDFGDVALAQMAETGVS